MIGTDSNYCKTVMRTLAGERKADEQTFESLAVLSERMERVKGLGGSFAGISFSPAVNKLMKQNRPVAVC